MANQKYKDIIDLPHYEPRNHPRMDEDKRAAQFAPFAALTGYGEIIDETGRLTDRRIDFSEDVKDAADSALSQILSDSSEEKNITVTYFVRDKFKKGGKYVTVSGKLKKLDDYERALILTNSEKIPLDDICAISESLNSKNR